MKNLSRLLWLAFALACLNTASFAQGVGVLASDPIIAKAFHNQGTFSSTQNYLANDVVSVGGALYYTPTAIAASSTPPPGNGWLPYGGGAATGAAITSTIGVPAGSQIFGDSISAATGASPFTSGYAFLVSQAYGGPQSVAQTSRSGEQALDGGTFLETGTANGNSDYVVEYGTNDISHYNSNSNLQAVFQRSYLHDLLWPSALNTAKFAQSCTAAGSGVADNSVYTGLGYELTATGSTLSCTVPATKAADNLYVGFHIFNGWSGTFTVSVDGVVQADPVSGSTTFVAYGDASANFATANTSACYGFGVQCGIVAVRLTNGGAGWGGGNHTVLFTATNASATTAIVEPDYAVFAPSSGIAATLPSGVAVTPNPRNDSYTSLVPTYLGFVTGIEASLAADGWPVVLANTNSALSTNSACTGGANPPFTNCYADGVLHPNNTGHAIMAAVVEAAVPPAHLTGVQIPNNNQATDITQTAPMNTPEAFWSPNPYGATVPATKWQPGIAWFKASGLVYGTGFVPGYGTTTFGPASGGNIASWCNYQITGYGQYPTPSALQTTCPFQLAGNAANFFLNPATGTSVLSVQANTLILGATNSATLAPTLNWNNYSANTYFQDPRAATASANYANGRLWYRANCWNGTVGTVDDVAWLNSPGSGASPAMVFKALLANGCGGSHSIDLSAFAGGAVLPAATTIGAKNVCLSDGTNCSTSVPQATSTTLGTVQYGTGVTPAPLGSASTRNVANSNTGGVCAVSSSPGTAGDVVVLDSNGQCPVDTGRQPTPMPTAAGQLPVANAGVTGFVPVTVSGDCNLAASGAMTCTKTNNVAFGSAATMNASAFDAAGAGGAALTAAAAAQAAANAAATAAAAKTSGGPGIISPLDLRQRATQVAERSGASINPEMLFSDGIAWVGGSSTSVNYAKGAKVTSGGACYQSIQSGVAGNINQNPATATAYWQPYTCPSTPGGTVFDIQAAISAQGSSGTCAMTAGTNNLYPLMTCTAVTGQILPGMTIAGTGVTAAQVVHPMPGTTTGTGSYLISVSQTVSSEAMTFTSVPTSYMNLPLTIIVDGLAHNTTLQQFFNLGGGCESGDANGNPSAGTNLIFNSIQTNCQTVPTVTTGGYERKIWIPYYASLEILLTPVVNTYAYTQVHVLNGVAAGGLYPATYSYFNMYDYTQTDIGAFQTVTPLSVTGQSGYIASWYHQISASDNTPEFMEGNITWLVDGVVQRETGGTEDHFHCQYYICAHNTADAGVTVNALNTALYRWQTSFYKYFYEEPFPFSSSFSVSYPNGQFGQGGNNGPIDVQDEIVWYSSTPQAGPTNNTPNPWTPTLTHNYGDQTAAAACPTVGALATWADSVGGAPFAVNTGSPSCAASAIGSHTAMVLNSGTADTMIAGAFSSTVYPKTFLFVFQPSNACSTTPGAVFGDAVPAGNLVNYPVYFGCLNGTPAWGLQEGSGIISVNSNLTYTAGTPVCGEVVVDGTNSRVSLNGTLSPFWNKNTGGNMWTNGLYLGTTNASGSIANMYGAWGWLAVYDGNVPSATVASTMSSVCSAWGTANSGAW